MKLGGKELEGGGGVSSRHENGGGGRISFFHIIMCSAAGRLVRSRGSGSLLCLDADKVGRGGENHIYTFYFGGVLSRL